MVTSGGDVETIGQQIERETNGVGELGQAVAAAIHQTPRFGIALGGKRFANARFATLEERGEQFRCYDVVMRQERIGEELIGEPDLAAEMSVIGAARQLNKAASAEPRTIGRGVVAETLAIVVEIEWLAARRGVEFRGLFADGKEAAGFDANGGERHRQQRSIGETRVDECVDDGREIAFDGRASGCAEEACHEIGGDLGKLGGCDAETLPAKKCRFR